jgi:hypothetical protein
MSMLLDSVVRGFASSCVAYMILCSSFAVVSLVRVSRAMGGVYGGALLWPSNDMSFHWWSLWAVSVVSQSLWEV